MCCGCGPCADAPRPDSVHDACAIVSDFGIGPDEAQHCHSKRGNRGMSKPQTKPIEEPVLSPSRMFVSFPRNAFCGGLYFQQVCARLSERAHASSKSRAIGERWQRSAKSGGGGGGGRRCHKSAVGSLE